MRRVITLDIPNAFIQTYVKDKKEQIILVLEGVVVELLCEIAPMYIPYVTEERGQKCYI